MLAALADLKEVFNVFSGPVALWLLWRIDRNFIKLSTRFEALDCQKKGGNAHEKAGHKH